MKGICREMFYINIKAPAEAEPLMSVLKDPKSPFFYWHILSKVDVSGPL